MKLQEPTSMEGLVCVDNLIKFCCVQEQNHLFISHYFSKSFSSLKPYCDVAE